MGAADVGLNALGLGFVLEAKDLAGEVIERFEGKFEKMEKSVEHGSKELVKGFSTMKIGLAELGVGFGILAGAFLAAHEAGEFSHELEGAAVTMRASREEMEKLHDAALSSRAAFLGFAPDETAKALNALAHSGANAEDSLAQLDAGMLLAKITGKDLTQETGFLNNTLSQFHMGSEEAHRTVDKLAEATRLFGLDAANMDVALQGVASGGQLANASLDDTIITLGLAKRVLPDVSSAARATNAAMLLLSEPKTKQEIRSLGVALTDLKGRSRPLIEVLGDMSEHLNKMTTAHRASYLATTFGGRAAGGLSVIMDQLSSGVKDAAGNLLTGAKAVAELRKQLDQTADDSAEHIAEQLGEALPAQEKVFAASMKRLTDAVGEPFEEAFGSILAGANRLINKLVDAFESLPEGTRTFLADLVLIGGALALVTGAVTVLTAAWPILAAVVGPLLGALATALVQVLVPVALVTAAAYAMKYAFEHNLGGIRDLVTDTWNTLSTIFRSIVALVTTGKITGPLLTEFKSAGAGVQQFAITVFLWFSRVKRFLENVGDGFREVLSQLGPQLGVLVSAVRRVGQAFGLIGDGPEAATDKMKQFAEAGRNVGMVLGVAFGVVVAVVTVAADVIGGAISAVSGVLGGLGDVVSGVVSVIHGLFTGNWSEVWLGFKKVVFGVVSAVMSILVSLVGVVGGVVDAIAGMFGKDLGIQKSVESFKKEFDRTNRVEFGLAAEVKPAAIAGPPARAAATLGVSPTQPATAAAGAQAGTNAELAASLRALAAKQQAAPQLVQTHTTIKLDNDVLAEHVARHETSTAARSFQPVPMSTK